MEMPEPWCGIRYDFRRRELEEEEEEEELTLTPHHTPSQSFDFIVWDKAYLDSIPAAGASREAPTLHSNFAPPLSTTKTVCVHGPSLHATASMCVHGPPPTMCVNGPSLDAASVCVHIGPYDNFKQRLVPPLHSPSPSRTDASTLMACRTDADLPPSFIDYKPRVSDAGLTSLEEVVRHYVHKHPEAIGAPSPINCRSTQRICNGCACNGMARLNVDHEVSLQRSYSQPGGGFSKGMFHVGLTKHTSKNNSAANGSSVFGRARIYQDQMLYAGSVPPARNRTKLSCCPTSPGRRKHRQVALDDCELVLASEISENRTLDLHPLQQEKLRCPACNLISDIQQNSKLLSPTAWADVTDVRGRRRSWPVGMQAAAPTAGYNQDSLSDISSDYDHHHDAAAALNMSKFKLWGLHHRFKALCRKLCSICTL